MIIRTIIAATLALGLGACATADDAGKAAEAPVAYTVINDDASIAFASSSIRTFRPGAERTLLLETNNGRWYRATLQGNCKSEVRWRQAIAIAPGASDRFDRFSAVLVGGRRCQVSALDEIADPDAPAAPAAPPKT